MTKHDRTEMPDVDNNDQARLSGFDKLQDSKPSNGELASGKIETADEGTLQAEEQTETNHQGCFSPILEREIEFAEKKVIEEIDQKRKEEIARRREVARFD